MRLPSFAHEPRKPYEPQEPNKPRNPQDSNQSNQQAGDFDSIEALGVRNPDSPDFHHGPDLYRTMLPVARLAMGLMYDRTTTGQEQIPGGPVIIVANHLRVVDSPLIALAYTEATGRPLRFGAKQEYFTGQGLSKNGEKPRFGRSMRWLVEHAGMIPVDRESHDPAAWQELMRATGAWLADGSSIGLHAEGTRSLDGKLHRFHVGAARLALAHGVPLLPAGVAYTDTTGQKKQAEIRFGEPLHVDPSSRLLRNPKLVTNELEARVADLTGQKRSGLYAAIPRILK